MIRKASARGERLITGLPPFVAPIEQSLRCICGLRYVGCTGGSDFDSIASEAAHDRASQMSAQFVDARMVPFIQCGCGALLDFFVVDSCELVM
jgi:hypothetical protein